MAIPPPPSTTTTSRPPPPNIPIHFTNKDHKRHQARNKKNKTNINKIAILDSAWGDSSWLPDEYRSRARGVGLGTLDRLLHITELAGKLGYDPLRKLWANDGLLRRLQDQQPRSRNASRGVSHAALDTAVRCLEAEGGVLSGSLSLTTSREEEGDIGAADGPDCPQVTVASSLGDDREEDQEGEQDHWEEDADEQQVEHSSAPHSPDRDYSDSTHYFASTEPDSLDPESPDPGNPNPHSPEMPLRAELRAPIRVEQEDSGLFEHRDQAMIGEMGELDRSGFQSPAHDTEGPSLDRGSGLAPLRDPLHERRLAAPLPAGVSRKRRASGARSQGQTGPDDNEDIRPSRRLRFHSLDQEPAGAGEEDGQPLALMLPRAQATAFILNQSLGLSEDQTRATERLVREANKLCQDDIDKHQALFDKRSRQLQCLATLKNHPDAISVDTSALDPSSGDKHADLTQCIHGLVGNGRFKNMLKDDIAERQAQQQDAARVISDTNAKARGLDKLAAMMDSIAVVREEMSKHDSATMLEWQRLSSLVVSGQGDPVDAWLDAARAGNA